MNQTTSGFSLTTAELAGMLGAELVGDGSVRVSNIETLDRAGPDDLGFVRSAAFADAATETKAGALLVTRGIKMPEGVSAAMILVEDADRALISILEGVRVHRFGEMPRGVHPNASVDERAELHETVTVGAGAVVQHAVRIGSGTVIGPGAVIMAGTTIGSDCEIGPNAVIGHEGFGYIVNEKTGERTHLPHVGGVTIGDRVDVGANSCIDRGKFSDTVIGNGCKIDNLVQIGHNCRFGENVVVCGLVGMGGSATVGDRAVFAGQSGVGDNITIANDVIVMAQGGVTRNLTAPGAYIGLPAKLRSEYVRERAVIRRLIKARIKPRDP